MGVVDTLDSDGLRARRGNSWSRGLHEDECGPPVDPNLPQQEPQETIRGAKPRAVGRRSEHGELMPERKILENERLTGFQRRTEANAEDREDVKHGVSLAMSYGDVNMVRDIRFLDRVLANDRLGGPGPDADNRRCRRSDRVSEKGPHVEPRRRTPLMPAIFIRCMLKPTLGAKADIRLGGPVRQIGERPLARLATFARRGVEGCGMNRCLRNFSVVALSLLLAGGVAWAQATARLDGRVTDESGGVLPGVTVTATQTDTGFTRTAVTDGTGAWIMSNLPTGPYRLEVSLQGFRTYVQTGIVLQVGATPTINAVLAVGSLEETVSVEAAAPIVDVRSAGISEVVDQERILAFCSLGSSMGFSFRCRV